MIVTESSWVSPVAYQSEGPFLVAVYQSLTGVDGFFWYTADEMEYSLLLAPGSVNPGGPLFIQKWSVSIPTILGGFPAAARCFATATSSRATGRPRRAAALESLESRPADDRRG